MPNPVISAVDMRATSDTVPQEVFLSDIMAILEAQADTGAYTATLPYLITDKQSLALIQLGYVLSIQADSGYTVIDWSKPA